MALRVFRRVLPLALALALLAGVACGPTTEEKVMGEIAARCEAQAGATLASAAAALRGGYPLGPRCSPSLAPLPSADTCGTASPGAELCQVLYEWFSADPGVCPGGACTCELRLREAELETLRGGATICAARFVHGEVSP